MKIFGIKCSKSSIGICNNVVNNRSSSFDSTLANSNRNDDPVCSSIVPSSILDLTTNTNGQVSKENHDITKNGNCRRQSKKLHASSSTNQLAISTPAICDDEKIIPTMIVPKAADLVTMRDKKSTSTMTRVQKLKKRLSHSFGRLSITKENHDIILPHNGYSDEFLDRFETIANMHDSKSSDVEYNHNKNNWNTNDWCDRVHRQLSVSSDSKLLDEDKPDSKKVIMRLKQPPRPKSEVFLSQQQQQQQQQQQNNENRRKRYSAFGGDSPYGKSENYIKFEPLGEGSYATVFKGYSILTNRIVALKEIRLLEQEGAPFTAIREASILKELKHANIVTLHDIVHTKETLTFVFEYLQTDLSHYLERHPYGLAYRNVKLFMFQLLRGLAYCHKHRVLHRDVKPQNLLISEIGELKLADFGLARVKSVPSHTYSHEVVTLWYRPPDVLLGSTEYSTSLDMWGVGCIFVEMIQGAAIFPGMKDVFSQLNKIFMRLGTPTEKTWPGVTSLPNYDTDQIYFYKPQDVKRNWPRLARLDYVCSLVESLLQLQPNKRISADDALRHPYFNSLPKKLLELPNDVSIFTVDGVRFYSEKHLNADR